VTKTKKQREHEATRDRVNAALKPVEGKIICRRCGATLETFDEVCDAPLDDMCDGFVVVELAHYPDGRNVVFCPEEQLTFARSLFERTASGSKNKEG
jgi:hypothetical protein